MTRPQRELVARSPRVRTVFALALVSLVVSIAVGAWLWMALDNLLAWLVILPAAGATLMLAATPHTMTIGSDGITWYGVAVRSVLHWRDVAAAGPLVVKRDTWIAARLADSAARTPSYGYPCRLGAGDRAGDELADVVGLLSLARPGRRAPWDVPEGELVSAVRRGVQGRWQEPLA